MLARAQHTSSSPVARDLSVGWVAIRPYVRDAAIFARSASHSGSAVIFIAASCSGVAHFGRPALAWLSSQSARSAVAAGAKSPLSETESSHE